MVKKEKDLERSCFWNWNGQVCRFDITQPEHMGRLILGLTALKAELATLPGDTDADLAMAVHSEILRHFFDVVLGVGMGETLCSQGGTTYALAYLDFMAFVSAQLQWLEALLDAAEQRYRLMGAALGWIAAMRAER